jgi:hypothetical protein
VRRLAIFALPFVVVALIGTGVTSAAAASVDPFAQSCPSTTLEEGATGKLNHNPAARKAIVPAGASALRLCRYYGFGAGRQTPKTQARAGKLQDQAVVHSRAVLEGLTFEFKELAAAPKGPISCPFDEGAELYAVFFYPHAKPVILRVSLSGCQFVSGAAPRARNLNRSLEHKLLRLVEGKRAKSPGPDKVTEKRAVERTSHLTIAGARHSVKEDLAEVCEGQCTASRILGCERKSSAIVVCRVEVTLTSGKVCHGNYRLRQLEGARLNELPGGDTRDECTLAFFPRELREMLEEENRREEEREAEEAKGVKRSYDRTAGG